MSCPERACASAAAVSISLSPCEVTKSIFRSTFSLPAHSLHSFAMASLAPGTQWSQNATASRPAACAPCTKGAVAKTVAAPAAVPSTRRRVIVNRALRRLLDRPSLEIVQLRELRDVVTMARRNRLLDRGALAQMRQKRLRRRDVLRKTPNAPEERHRRIEAAFWSLRRGE